MKHRYFAGSLIAAVLLLVLGMTGAASAQDCAALGGTVNGVECQISSAVTASGTFNLAGQTLHLFGTGSITTGGNALTLNVGLDMILETGALIDANKPKGTCNTGGALTFTVGQNANFKIGSTIRSNSCSGGPITITAGQAIQADGLIESVGSNTSAFGGVNIAPGGGPITLETPCNLTVTGTVSSRGKDPGADLVRLVGGCFVKVFGLVESTGIGHRVPNTPPNHCNGAFRPGKPANSTACVEIIGGDLVVIDSVSPNNGEVNADTGGVGGVGHQWIDIFAKGPIQIIGDVAAPFAVHANGLSGANDRGGDINVKSRDASVTASGLAIQANALKGDGGLVVVQGATDVNLNDSQNEARGDSNPTGGFGVGGQIQGKGFNGVLTWQNTATPPDSIGNVLPTGTNVPAAERGVITLESCTGVPNVNGTQFPALGANTTPTLNGGLCGGAPTFPAYVVFPDCACLQAGCPCVAAFACVPGTQTVRIQGTELTGVNNVLFSTASCNPGDPGVSGPLPKTSQTASDIIVNVAGLAAGTYKVITTQGSGSCCSAATINLPCP
jgi:hypothetical protein